MQYLHVLNGCIKYQFEVNCLDPSLADSNVQAFFKLLENPCPSLSNQNKLGDYPGGGGILPYMGYIGMLCGPKGYGFSAVLVRNWVSILAILPPIWS